ncbi:MAG: class I SAM-dependent methyltransferase [Pseudomonadota bacterium]
MTIKSWIYDNFVANRYDDALAEITEQFRQTCIEQTQIGLGQTVLDIGCGTGLNQPILASAVGEEGKIIAVDASTAMLAQAQDRAIAGGYADRITLIHGDLRQIHQLVTTPVDAVIATLIFSVVPDWRGVFTKSFELLRPGGRYGVMDNYWPNPSLRLWYLSWTFAANAKRPGFEPLQKAAEDFVLGYYPPDEDIQFYVAHGTKPANL